MRNAMYRYNPDNGSELVQVKSVTQYEKFDVLIVSNIEDAKEQGWHETPLQAIENYQNKIVLKEIDKEINDAEFFNNETEDDIDADNSVQRKRGRPRK